MEQYKILFTVKFYHEFLRGFTMKDFDLIVTAESVQIMQSYQLKIKALPGGFFVFGTQKSVQLFETIKNQDKLVFGLNNKSPSFGSKTNVLLKDLGIKYYVNNLNIRQKDSLVKLLHDGSFLSEAEMLQFVYSYDSVSRFVKVEDALVLSGGQEVYSGGSKNVKAGTFLLRDFGLVKINQNTNSDFLDYYYSSEMLSNSFGVIDIDLSSFKAASSWGEEYQVNFQNRLIFWNYIFVSSDQNELEEVKIFNGKDEFLTEPAIKEILPNGKVGYRLNATNEIALYKDYGKFRLVADIYNNEGNKRIKLPIPDPIKVKGMINEGGVEQFYSDMYVFY